VVAGQTGEAVPYARIAIVGGATGSRIVRTDLQGRFAFSSTTPRPHIRVTKAGYAAGEMTVAGAPVVNEIRLALGAVISGRVTDDAGDPVINARIAIETPARPSAPVNLVATVQTDDRGEYRVGDLAAGTLVVSATVFPTAKVYFPGTAALSDAEAIRLAPGTERADVDFIVPTPPLANLLVVGTNRLLIGGLVPRSAPSGGGASVSGRVTTTGGAPLANALVQLVDAHFASVVTHLSGGDGRFEFVDLARGQYRLLASKPGYSATPGKTASAAFSAGVPGVPVNLADSQSRERADLTLTKLGVIAGRVLDEYGDPMQRAKVQLLQLRYESGRRGLVLMDVVSPLTDDLGGYRLHDVPPGQYVVSATVGDVATADIAGYARTYFPGTANPAQAQFVTLRTGSELGSIDIGLSPSRTARVSGRLLDADGHGTTGGSLSLRPSVRSSATVGVSVGATVSADGTFEFANVPPGQYVIQADRGRRTSSIEGEFGSLPVLVAEGDVSGLMLQTSRGSTISGFVSVESITGQPPALPTGIEISPVAVDLDQSPRSVATAAVGRDGSFTLAGVNGPRRLQLMKVPAGWGLKQINVNGVDITDRAIAFGRINQSLTDVEVVLTDAITQLDGGVADEKGRPVGAANVVVFSADRDRWYRLSRFMQRTVTAEDGRFAVEGLPFGTYHVVAVGELPEGEDAWQDPAYLETLVTAGKTVTLIEREPVAVSLPLRAR
jgi:protocatechuate 3,4-dioxygenase beta subunit